MDVFASYVQSRTGVSAAKVREQAIPFTAERHSVEAEPLKQYLEIDGDAAAVKAKIESTSKRDRDFYDSVRDRGVNEVVSLQSRAEVLKRNFPASVEAARTIQELVGQQLAFLPIPTMGHLKVAFGQVDLGPKGVVRGDLHVERGLSSDTLEKKPSKEVYIDTVNHVLFMHDLQPEPPAEKEIPAFVHWGSLKFQSTPDGWKGVDGSQNTVTYEFPDGKEGRVSYQRAGEGGADGSFRALGPREAAVSAMLVNAAVISGVSDNKSSTEGLVRALRKQGAPALGQSYVDRTPSPAPQRRNSWFTSVFG